MFFYTLKIMENFKDLAINVLDKYIDNTYCIINIFVKLNEPHRHYHNWNVHIEYMFKIARKLNIELTDELILAIIFHDIIYDQLAKDNEVKSANFFYNLIKNDNVYNAILDTTHDHEPKSELGKTLCFLDLYNLYDTFDVFYDNSYKIFKEYQFVEYSIYKEERKKLLEKLNVNPDWINAVYNFKPNIGVYPGSYNPYHIGHENIRIKADQIFDKVIIARGINPSKNNEIKPLPSDALKYYQVDYYDGLLTDYLDSKDYEMTVIRGLRNGFDLEYEMNQYQILKDLKPNIKVVSLFADKQFDHVSSSAIRALEKYGKGNNYIIN